MSSALLIFGASGFVGGRLSQAASADGWRAVGTALNGACPRGVVQVVGDVRSREFVSRCIEHERPACVVYCAATQFNGQGVNTDGVQHVVDALAKYAHDAKLIYVSSSTVFDGTYAQNTESAIPNAQNRTDNLRDYGMTKMRGEQIALTWRNAIVARTTTVEGLDASGKLSHRLAGLMELVQSGRAFTRFVDRLITPTLVDNLVATLLEVASPAFTFRGVLHICGAQTLTDYNYAQCVATWLGADVNRIVPQLIADSAIPQTPRNTGLDCTYTQTQLRTTLMSVDAQLTHLRHQLPNL
jgi:dTDP-4-dehydrorhamnose reductase